MSTKEDILDLITVYPRYKSIADQIQNCKLKCSYECNEVECNFNKCIHDVKKQKDITQFEKYATLSILNILQENLERFAVKNIGGFIIESKPSFEFLIQNATHENPQDDRRYGFINLPRNKKLGWS